MRAPSHVRRFTAGLAVALAAGVAAGALVTRGAWGQLEQDRQTRTSIVSLLALADLVGRAGGEGDAVRALLAAWQARQPPGADARVVLFQGARLEASSAPGDAGERAAPRRLGRDEKPLFDRGQRLRGAMEANREGGAPKPEVEVERLPGGGQSLAAPVEIEGRVAGFVQMTAPPQPAPAAPAWAWMAVVAVLAWVGYALAAHALGERRWVLAALALLVLAGVLVAIGTAEVLDLADASRAAHAAVAAQARRQAEASSALDQAAPGAAAATSPAAWDADLYRRPRGFVGTDGALVPGAVAADAAAVRSAAARSLAATGALAVLLLAVVGLGGASGVARALVTHRQAYAYIAPAVVGTLLLVFFPFFYGIALSFTDSNIYNTSQPLTDLWIGLKNYVAILGDLDVVRRGADGSLVFNYLNFYWTFLFTVIWTVTNVTWGVSFGLLLALALDTKGLALRPIYRVLLILPWAMPNYITALIWKGMFHRQFGVVNQLLALGGMEPLSWFDRPFTSYLTALATNGWLSFPFMMVVSLGALQSIPADLYEAARVDGASRWQQFRAITLPSLRPALVPAVILSVVWTFNMFNVIYLVTAGEPGGATEILVTQAFKYAFQRYRYGYAAAYATIIFGILLVYGTIQNRVTRATEAL